MYEDMKKQMLHISLSLEIKKRNVFILLKPNLESLMMQMHKTAKYLH